VKAIARQATRDICDASIQKTIRQSAPQFIVRRLQLREVVHWERSDPGRIGHLAG
jgi:hypothetical protein